MWKNNNCEWKMIKTKTKSASLRFKSWMQWSAEKHFILSVFILSISISFHMCFFYFNFVIFFFIVVYFINLSKTLENEESHKKRTATTFEEGKKKRQQTWSFKRSNDYNRMITFAPFALYFHAFKLHKEWSLNLIIQ